MAKKQDFSTPAFRPDLENPALHDGAMAHSQPFVAAPEHQEALGFPGELVEN